MEEKENPKFACPACGAQLSVENAAEAQEEHDAEEMSSEEMRKRLPVKDEAYGETN